MLQFFVTSGLAGN